MIDDVQGRTVFYDIYTGQQTAEDPTKENTVCSSTEAGPARPFAVVAPGGGFPYVGSVWNTCTLFSVWTTFERQTGSRPRRGR